MGLRQLQLGAHPIGARHQQRLAQPCRQAAETAEAPQTSHHLRPTGGLNTGADALNEGPAGHDVHAGCAVIHRLRPADPPILPRRRAHPGLGSAPQRPYAWTKSQSAHALISVAYLADDAC